MAGALAEAAADTVSSECGQAFSDRARLITTFEEVAAGTDGGVSLVGTLTGACAALLVSAVCLLTGVLDAFDLDPRDLGNSGNAGGRLPGRVG